MKSTEPIDIEALRRELAELKEKPDVKRYHATKAKLMGASGRGASKARPQHKTVATPTQ